tara:strand:+ start:208 stop:681 length:474 start_codon:yes stop_codon:yes gene_type:complete
MTPYFNVIDTLTTALKAEPFTNSVTFGDLDDVDLNKLTIFPLAHIIVNTATINEETISMNISILLADTVLIKEDKVWINSSENVVEKRGNNEQEVQNTQLAIASRLMAKLQRGTLYENKYQLNGAASLEPFVERFENKLAGWSMTFDILIPNDMTIC